VQCVHAESVVLSWDRNPDEKVFGYVVYYGEVKYQPNYRVDVGYVDSAVIKQLNYNSEWYFSVSAYGSDRIESEQSEPIAWRSWLVFSKSYGSEITDDNYNELFDFDNDGDIDGLDASEFYR
jgi:hypothetical protein